MSTFADDSHRGGGDPDTECVVEILGGSPVRVTGIYGIGRNFAAHGRELGNPVPTEPVVFMKPVSSLLSDGGTIELPARSCEIQHEVEIVLLIGAAARDLDVATARESIAGYAVGIDVTARDLQRHAQQSGLPWVIAKGQETFAPVSRFLPAARIAPSETLRFELAVNGEMRQTGSAADMLFDFAEIVAYLSRLTRLRRGDLIFTGTPEGVGPIVPGDVLSARLLGHDASITVDAKSRPVPAAHWRKM
ncbi:MAG: fumarylacetoacetate hydrolase family protein [Methylotetracoccus sp.]